MGGEVYAVGIQSMPGTQETRKDIGGAAESSGEGEGEREGRRGREEGRGGGETCHDQNNISTSITCTGGDAESHMAATVRTQNVK